MFANVPKLARWCVLATLVFAAVPAQSPARAEGTASPTHKAFVLFEYQVRDQPLFLKVRDQVRATLKTYHGELVTREKVQPIFGGTPTNLSIVSFDSVQDARAWLASKELAALAQQRDAAAKITTYLVEKFD